MCNNNIIIKLFFKCLLILVDINVIMYQNRLYSLPDEILKLIWKYYFDIILIEMYQKIFIRDPVISMTFTPKKLCFYTWNDYYNNYSFKNSQICEFICRNRKFKNDKVWYNMKRLIPNNSIDRWYIKNNRLYYRTTEYYLL